MNASAVDCLMSLFKKFMTSLSEAILSMGVISKAIESNSTSPLVTGWKNTFLMLRCLKEG